MSLCGPQPRSGLWSIHLLHPCCGRLCIFPPSALCASQISGRTWRRHKPHPLSLSLPDRRGPSGTRETFTHQPGWITQHFHPPWVLSTHFKACFGVIYGRVGMRHVRSARRRQRLASVSGFAVFVHTAPGWCRAQKPNVLLFTSSVCVSGVRDTLGWLYHLRRFLLIWLDMILKLGRVWAAARGLSPGRRCHLSASSEKFNEITAASRVANPANSLRPR